MAEYLIPKPDQKIPRAAAVAEHPGYQAQLRTLRFGRENYEGSGGYAPFLDDVTLASRVPDDEQGGTLNIQTSARTYLFRHPREKKKFERRYAMSYLTNVIKKAVNMLSGFLTKKQPTYDKYPKAVRDWMANVTPEGDTWEQFKSHDVVPQVIYYGWLPVIFYRAPTDAVTVEQQIAEGGVLVAEVINPENIVHWKANANGFVWLKVKTQVDLTGPLDEQQVLVDRYTWYTQEGYWAVDDDKTTTELPIARDEEGRPIVGEWSNGMPIVVWALRGGALTQDANAVQRECFNVNSLIQEQERETTFAMLAAPGRPPGEGQRVQQSGSDNVWWFDDQAKHAPTWMAPPPHVLDHFMTKRAALIEECLSTMGLDFDSGGGQTGVAFQFKMSKIVRLLQVTADSFSRSESRSLARVGIEEGSPVDDKVRCVWPSEFDAKDVEKEMDGFERVIAQVKSEAAKVEAQVKLALVGLGDMDEKLRSTIRKEVETSEKEAGLDEDNNPDELQARGEDARERLEEGGEEDMDDLAADGGAR
jgi:hypothetical protein